MKKRQFKMTGVLLMCLLFLGIAVAQEKPAATVNAPFAGATVSDFKGKVGVQLPGQAMIAPTRGEILPAESVVSTDEGRLLLRLSDGSDILVRPHTKLIVKQPETNGWKYLELMMGRIRNQIQRHLGGTPSFQMGTPSAVISVRGTVFDVEVDRRGNTEVDVDEGVVELSSAEGHGESVMVTAGFSSRIGMEGRPEAPRPTHDLRPQLDRPGRHDKNPDKDDDAIRRLEAADRDRSGRDGDSRGGSSDGGSLSGSSGSGSSGVSGGSGGTSGGSGSSDGGSQSGSGSSGSSDDGGDRHRDGGSGGGTKPPGFF